MDWKKSNAASVLLLLGGGEVEAEAEGEEVVADFYGEVSVGCGEYVEEFGEEGDGEESDWVVEDEVEADL